MRITINWRKPIIYSLLYCSGSKIPARLKEINDISQYTPEELKQYQNKKLENLLLYAYENVPYYQKVLPNAGVIIDGKVWLERFDSIPVLTKEVIRKEATNLQTQEKRRGLFENTSGGSTGEPVRFLQDQYYVDWNLANKIYYKTFANQDIGQPELRLWGSERDLLEGKEKFSIRLRNWLYNRKELNSFKLSDEGMHSFVKEWNYFKPEWVEAYVQSIYEFGRFVQENGYTVHKPKGVLTTAGTLNPEMKKLIEEVFKTKIFNRYGTREVGDIACSCEKDDGLHISTHNQYLEIIRGDNSKYGKVLVTNLNNFAMPLIRYDIGDIATPVKDEMCSCGRSFPLIGSVEGREMSMFKTKKGKLIPGEFFIHFIGVVHNKGVISKFQVMQKEYDKIIIKAVVNDMNEFEKERPVIESSIFKVMEDDCIINWDFVDDIDSMKSGKYIYTICEI